MVDEFDIQNTSIFLIINLFVFILFTYLASYWNYFSLKKNDLPSGSPSLFQLAFVYAFFISSALLLSPLVFSLIYYGFFGVLITPLEIKTYPSIESWYSIAVMLLSSSSTLFASRFLMPLTDSFLWNKTGFNLFSKIKSFGVGMFFFFISYPLVVFIGHCAGLIKGHFFSAEKVDQVAVSSVKASLENPSLFIAISFCMIVLVPPLEELLFRGYLQTWLKSYFNRAAAIALASLTFSFFHFSLQQGYSNVELLFALFTLSCFLGFLYERQGTLWAPIGLHAFFNAANIILIFLAY